MIPVKSVCAVWSLLQARHTPPVCFQRVDRLPLKYKRAENPFLAPASPSLFSQRSQARLWSVAKHSQPWLYLYDTRRSTSARLSSAPKPLFLRVLIAIPPYGWTSRESKNSVCRLTHTSSCPRTGSSTYGAITIDAWSGTFQTMPSTA